MNFLHGVGSDVLVPIHDESVDTQQPGGALHHQGDNAGQDHCHLQPGQSRSGDSDVSPSIQCMWKALLISFRCGDIVAFTAIVFRKNMPTILVNFSTHMNKSTWRFIRDQVLLHIREWENHAGKCQSQHHHQCNQLVGQDVHLPHHRAVREVLHVTVESTLVSAHVFLLPADEDAGGVLLLSQVPIRTEDHDGHHREEHQHRAAHDNLEGYHLHHDSQILKGKFVDSEKDLTNNYHMHDAMSEAMIQSDVLVSLPEIGGPTTNADRQGDVDMGQADSNVLVTATRVFGESHDFLIFLSDAKTIAKLV